MPNESMTFRIAACLVVSVGFCVLTSATLQAQTWTETGDAGQTLERALLAPEAASGEDGLLLGRGDGGRRENGEQDGGKQRKTETKCSELQGILHGNNRAGQRQIPLPPGGFGRSTRGEGWSDRMTTSRVL